MIFGILFCSNWADLCHIELSKGVVLAIYIYFFLIFVIKEVAPLRRVHHDWKKRWENDGSQHERGIRPYWPLARFVFIFPKKEINGWSIFLSVQIVFLKRELILSSSLRFIELAPYIYSHFFVFFLSIKYKSNSNEILFPSTKIYSARRIHLCIILR